MKLEIRKNLLVLLYFIIVVSLFLIITYAVSRPLGFILEKYRKINNINQSKIITNLERAKLRERCEKIRYTNPQLFFKFVKPAIQVDID